MTAVLTDAPKAAVKPSKTAFEFKVRDLSLADWGRKEIMLAEQEMPGLDVGPGRVCRRSSR